MEKFVLWEAPISMRVEWKCASMTSGGQCVMMTGTLLMLLLYVGNSDTHILEVSMNICSFCQTWWQICVNIILSKQLAGYSSTLSLVLGLVLSSWMMSSATQVLVNYWSVPVAQSWPITAFTLRMLVLGVKVYTQCWFIDQNLLKDFTVDFLTTYCMQHLV